MIVSIGDGRQAFASDGMGDDLGGTSWGRLINAQAVSLEQCWYISWQKELAEGIRENDVAVLLYHDGSFSHAVTGRDYDMFVPDKMSPVDRVDLWLVPNDSAWRTMIWQDALATRVNLWWEMEEFVPKVRIMGNRGAAITATTPLAEFTKPMVYQFHTTKNSDVDVAGTWTGDLSTGGEVHEAIRCEIKTAGYADEAKFRWKWYGHDEWVNNVTASSAWIELVNGVRIRFHTGAWFEVDDFVPIVVCLPEEYTTGKWWPGGDVTLRIDYVNSAGVASTGNSPSNPKTVTINTPPATPTLNAAPVYVDGSGQILIAFKSPAEADVSHYRIYQSRAYLGERQVHWNPVVQGVTTSGGVFTMTVPGLGEGWNRISGTVIDTGGKESGECIWEIELDATLNAILPPNPPIGIACKVLSDGTIDVKVWADSTSDTINVYQIDETTGDYGSPILEITNYQTGDYQELTDIWDPADEILKAFIGARAQNGSIEESNTDIVDHVTRTIKTLVPPDVFLYEVVP